MPQLGPAIPCLGRRPASVSRHTRPLPRNIGAVLILMPEASWFRAITPPEGEPKLRPFIDNLAHDFGVFVIDARDWCPDEEFFLDGHHLLAAGGCASRNDTGVKCFPDWPHLGLEHRTAPVINGPGFCAPGARMLFCTQQFLLFFLAVFAAYWAMPWERPRIMLLLAASVYFYACWNHWLALGLSSPQPALS